MKFKSIDHSVNIITIKKGEKLYGMTCAWAMQCDYDKLLCLLGSQSETLKVIEKGDIIGVNVLAKDQIDISLVFGEKHSSEINKFIGLNYKLNKSAVLIEGSVCQLSCEVIDILHLNEIEEDLNSEENNEEAKILMDKIDNFRLKHPKIKIKLIDLSTRALIDELEEQKIDFIVDSSPIESIYNNIDIVPICKLNTCFIKSSNNDMEIKKISDLQGKNIILPTPRSSLRKNLNRILEANETTVDPILEFDTEELIIDSVRRDLGIGYVVENAIEYLVDAKIVDYVKIDTPLPKIELNLLYITSYLPKIAKVFIEEEIMNEK